MHIDQSIWRNVDKIIFDFPLAKYARWSPDYETLIHLLQMRRCLNVRGPRNGVETKPTVWNWLDSVQWTPNLALYWQKPNYPIKARLGVLPISNCINNACMVAMGFKYMILSGQTGLNKQMGLERSGFVQVQYEKRKVQRRSFVWWFKNLLGDCSKKIFRMMNQRISFRWWSKEGLSDDEPKKIFFMKAQRGYFVWWFKEDLLDEG